MTQPAAARTPASPLARRLARAAGLSLAAVRGTGPGGRVVRHDVDAAIRARHHVGIESGRAATVSGGVAAAMVVRRSVRLDALLACCAELNEPDQPEVTVGDLMTMAVTRAHAVVSGVPEVWLVDLGDEGVDEGAVPADSAHPAVLTLGAPRQEVVLAAGTLVIGTVLRATLSVPASILDAQTAARWLNAFATRIERPARLLR